MSNTKGSLLCLASGVLVGVWLVVFSGQAIAGNLEPPGPPGSTMKTLDEVEPRIPISSLPFTISQSGSYYLTGNLSAIGIGITVNADDVTIDLMGYTINGGTGYGIYMSGRSNVEIRNGTIKGFGNHGIYESGASGEGHRVIRVRVIGNSSNGIYLMSSANLVRDCTAIRSGNHGIYSGLGSTVSNNIAYDNGSVGIKAGSGNAVSNNTVYDNGGSGIQANLGSTVSNNTAYDNGNSGIFVSDGCTVINNAAYSNEASGIVVYSGTAKNNTAILNQDHGISILNGLADGNTATSNNQSGESNVNLDCNSCTLGTNHAP